MKIVIFTYKLFRVGQTLFFVFEKPYVLSLHRRFELAWSRFPINEGSANSRDVLRANSISVEIFAT